jgi:hypothetical protein
METREHRVSKHLRIDLNLHQWFENEAKRQNRSVNAEMQMALRFWKQTRRKNTMYLPEEKDLNVNAEDIKSDRKIIAEHEAKIKDFEAKAAAANGPRRGAYQGHVTKTKKSLDAMSGNLAYHLDWLRRFKPTVYEEVK